MTRPPPSLHSLALRRSPQSTLMVGLLAVRILDPRRAVALRLWADPHGTLKFLRGSPPSRLSRMDCCLLCPNSRGPICVILQATVTITSFCLSTIRVRCKAPELHFGLFLVRPKTRTEKVAARWHDASSIA